MVFSQTTLENAKAIAENCQGSHRAFCASRCPMHCDVIGYVNLIGEGKTTDAIKKIREALFLPGTLGRICAHPCETVCRRETEFNQPIAIAALKRYAADMADDESLWDISKKPQTGKKIAVIGAGPAGAQAAIDLAKEGHDVAIYEKLDVVGGMMRVGIPEYRLPRNLIDREYTYLTKLGIAINLGVEIGKDMPFNELANNHDAVIVANGAHQGFVPPIKGAETGGITNAADFLKSVSLGDKNLKVGKNVLVVGGGDVAMDCARTALRLGAESVNLVSLERMEELPASKHEQTGSLDEGVVFNLGWGGEEIFSENGSVSGIKLKECTSVFDAEGKFSPSFSENTQEISCDMLIFATGQRVQDVTGGALAQGGGSRYDADKDTLATSVDKVFVAGDCAGATIVVEAMALGRKAAVSVNRFLAGMDLKEDRDLDNEYSCETALDIPLPEDLQDLPRKHTRELDPKARIGSFEECDLGFDDETALQESQRCIKCECKQCMTECIMFNEFTQFPGMMFEAFLKDGKIEPLAVYSCNMCDQCTIVCPEDFKFAALFGDLRKDMVIANNGESPMAGHKAINMHQKLGFSKMFTTRKKGGK
ncbi:MAG: FAD-dependent oxidoreductase [Clostridiales bacterium]|nr:FAD-dependent oxidoreductase [Clostridiales bacterium]